MDRKELVKPDFNIIEKVRYLGDTSVLNHWNWHFFRSSNAVYLLEDVTTSSPDYNKVSSAFNSTRSGRTGRTIDLLKIKRVENPFLMAQYLLKKEQTNFNERWVFHGTNIENMESICTTNFNWRKAVAHKFGYGVSFSPKAFYANHYSRSYTHYTPIMFFSKMLYKNKYLGNSEVKVPMDNYDTTCNYNDDVLVKFEDNDFYPAYIIYFI